MPGAGTRPSRFVIAVSLAFLCGIWGSTWLVIREGLDDLPPYTSATARFALATAGMAFLAMLLGKREGGAPPPTWLWVTMGVLNFAVSYAIVYRTETLLPSGLVALIWGIYPLLSALAGQAFLEGEQLSARQWGGLVLGIAGLALLFVTDLRDLGPGSMTAGLVLLWSPIACVVGTTAVKKKAAETNSLLLNRNGMALGTLLMGGLAVATEWGAPMQWTPSAIGSVLYLSLIGTVTSFAIYFWLLRFVTMYRMSLISYVTPAVALFLGNWVRSEPITSGTLAGAALILGGVGLTATRGRGSS